MEHSVASCEQRPDTPDHAEHRQPAFSIRSLAALALAAGGFASLWLVAPYVGGDVDIMGLTDETVHNIAHLTVYGGLALLIAGAMRGHLVLAWFISNLLAAAEEWHQQFVPGRIMGWDDMILNVTGISVALVGLGIVLLLRRHWHRRLRFVEDPVS